LQIIAKVSVFEQQDMAPDSTHCWVELLAQLTQGRNGNDAQRKCSVRLLDTIHVPSGGDVNDPQWYFTTKSGSIARKKGDKSSLAGVYERFSKFALANPNNTHRTVGVFVHGNGYRQHLNETNLQEMLSVNSSVLLQKNSHLQVYLRPYKGRDEIASCRVRKTPAGKYEFECVTGPPDGGVSPVTSPGVLDQMKGFAQEMLSHLRDTRGIHCSTAQVDFIVDDNEHVWLAHIPQATFGPDAGVNENKETSENIQLPQVDKTSSDHDEDLMRAALGSATDSRPSSRGPPPRPGSSNSKAGWGAHLLGGDLLSRNSDSAFCCKMGPDDLPGLRAWSLVSFGGDNLQWSVDMDEYNPDAVMSPNPTVEAVRRQRSEQRHKEPGTRLWRLCAANAASSAIRSLRLFSW